MKNKEKKPLALVILDGWGVGQKDKTINAIEAAKTPFYDTLIDEYPHTQLGASGTDVGLEDNQMSGSEAGHMNIGAGRIVKQDIRMILEDICKGIFAHNPSFLSLITKIKKAKSNIHLMGLMGNADSPHSHPDVFMALLVLLKKHNFNGKVFVHLFTDGRDSFPRSALEHLHNWRRLMYKVGIGEIASISGRFYAMDRAKNWERVMKAYEVMVNPKGEGSPSAENVIRENYTKGNSDEYVEPAFIVKDGKPVATIKDNDGIIFFNFRSDRARQLTKLFVGTHNFTDKTMPQINPPRNLTFIAMTNFGPDLNLETAYYTTPVINTLPAALIDYRQLYIAETEKYAHVTYFINGGYSDPVAGEERILIPSPVLRSYAEKPEMSAEEVTQTLVEAIKADRYDFYTVNFANADMVGHTGDFAATAKAVEFLDKQLKQIYCEISKKDGLMIVTSDHGNADIMIDRETGKEFTFHTKNPVPFILASENKVIKDSKLTSRGILADIAPTILDLMDVIKPMDMKGKSLIENRGRRCAIPAREISKDAVNI